MQSEPQKHKEEKRHRGCGKPLRFWKDGERGQSTQYVRREGWDILDLMKDTLDPHAVSEGFLVSPTPSTLCEVVVPTLVKSPSSPVGE